MKLARLDDLRRALEKRNAATVPTFEAFQFADLPGFADAAITPNASFIAICGGTGVGKSALLELIYATLTYDGSDPRKPSARLGNAAASIKVKSPDGDYEGQLHIGSKEKRKTYTPYCALVDLKERTSECQDFSRQDGFNSLLEGLTPSEIDQDTMGILSFVCRKSYEKILAYEVDYGFDEVIPHFEVIENGRSYDSRTMATGEMSAIFLAWILKFVPPKSIILIEEPEAHLPPSGHGAIFGLICQAAVKRKLSFIVTTHSPDVAAHFGDGNLIMLRTQSGKSIVPASTESKERVLSKLGLAPQKSAILFVEDRLASILLSEIVAIFEFAISTSIEIVQSAGAGGVRVALEGLPSNLKSFDFIGVLDGDVRADSQSWSCRNRLVYLPFDSSMEVELLSAVSSHPKSFGKLVNRSLTQVEAALEANAGFEGHDQFYGVAGSLGLSYEALAISAFQVWLRRCRGLSKTTRFARGLAEALGVSLPTALN